MLKRSPITSQFIEHFCLIYIDIAILSDLIEALYANRVFHSAHLFISLFCCEDKQNNGRSALSSFFVHGQQNLVELLLESLPFCRVFVFAKRSAKRMVVCRHSPEILAKLFYVLLTGLMRIAQRGHGLGQHRSLSGGQVAQLAVVLGRILSIELVLLIQEPRLLQEVYGLFFLGGKPVQPGDCLGRSRLLGGLTVRILLGLLLLRVGHDFAGSLLRLLGLWLVALPRLRQWLRWPLGCG